MCNLVQQYIILRGSLRYKSPMGLDAMADSSSCTFWEEGLGSRSVDDIRAPAVCRSVGPRWCRC